MSFGGLRAAFFIRRRPSRFWRHLMHRLLYPAMRLMNRLSFSLKFSLISAVFFLPLIGLSGFLALESYRQLAYGQHERASLKPLSDVLSLLGKVERLHVQVQIQTALGQGAAGDELRHQSERLKSEIVERLQALQPVSSEANAFKEFQEKRQALLETAAELQQPAMGIGETARVARLLTQQEVFVKFVAAQAGLLLDGQREVRQVVELLIGLLPEVSRLLGEGEALGSTALIKGFVSSNENDRLNNLLVVLEKNQSDYALGLAEANLGATALQAVAQDSQLALRKGLEFLTQSVVEAASLNMPWQQFQRDYGHAQEQLQRFGGASLEFLDEQLQRRLNEKRRQLASLVGGLLLVMLLIAFLYGGFFLATRSALQNLAEMLGRVADGDMTAHVRVDSRDELGELGRAFNVTVAKIHDLIERVGHTVTE
ncbi:HAMP domain-containing protein, partial [Pseudomonas sp. CrR25]|nr:HAMP domain-containing protein [Pseudomonas sp. CrR25]